MIKHVVRMDYHTESYQYTREDYVKDTRVTWESSDRMTKHFVIRATEFDREQEAARKPKKKRRKKKRTRPAAQQSAPAQVVPAQVVPAPAPPIPPAQINDVPQITGLVNPKPPRDRSTPDKSTLVDASDNAYYLRMIVNNLRKGNDGNPPKIVGSAADALLRELDKLDLHLHALFSHVQ